MKGFAQNIEDVAIKNNEFRRVLYTAKYCQLVVMALSPKEEIGAEVHKLDQFFRVEEGTGEAVLDGVGTAIQAGFAVLVPAGTKHNIINTGSVPRSSIRSMRRQIIATVLSTMPARTRRPTPNTSMARRLNRSGTQKFMANGRNARTKKWNGSSWIWLACVNGNVKQATCY